MKVNYAQLRNLFSDHPLFCLYRLQSAATKQRNHVQGHSGWISNSAAVFPHGKWSRLWLFWFMTNGSIRSTGRFDWKVRTSTATWSSSTTLFMRWRSPATHSPSNSRSKRTRCSREVYLFRHYLYEFSILNFVFTGCLVSSIRRNVAQEAFFKTFDFHLAAQGQKQYKPILFCRVNFFDLKSVFGLFDATPIRLLHF